MKTVKVVLKKNKKSDTYGYIKLRITSNRIPTYKSLKIKILEKHWLDKKQRVSSLDHNFEEINKIIEQKLKEFYGNKVSPITNTKSLLTYHRNYIKTILNAGSFKRENTELNRMISYLDHKGIKDISFDEITKEFILEYIKFLKDENVGVNTRNKYIRDFRSLVNKAIEDDVVFYPKSPFNSVPLKSVEVVKERLSDDDVKKIIGLKTEKGSKLFHTRNLFLFQIFSLGMRVSDLQLLRWNMIEGGRLNYVMFKTRTPINLFLNDNLLELLVNYSPCYNSKEYFETEFFVENNYLFNSVPFEEIEYSDSDFSGVNGHIISLNEIDEYIFKLNDEILNLISFDEDTSKKEIKSLSEKIESLQSLRTNCLLEVVKNTVVSEFGNNFIFPFLKEEDFEDIGVKNDYEKIMTYHYKKMMSRTTIYNKNLKLLQKECNISITIRSHIARHTFTELMLNLGQDLYTISKSLGHKNFSVTQTYVNSFHKEKVDSGNRVLSDGFDLN